VDGSVFGSLQRRLTVAVQLACRGGAMCSVKDADDLDETLTADSWDCSAETPMCAAVSCTCKGSYTPGLR
jgi:hypothetical protein